MLDVGASISKPRRDGRDAETYGRYQEITGNSARQQLGALIGIPQYQALPNEEKQDLIKDIMTDARRKARGMLSASGGAVPNQPADVPPPPPGFVIEGGRSTPAKPSAIPPPPPGFTLQQ